MGAGAGDLGALQDPAFGGHPRQGRAFETLQWNPRCLAIGWIENHNGSALGARDPGSPPSPSQILFITRTAQMGRVFGTKQADIAKLMVNLDGIEDTTYYADLLA
ncbi:hypothetical protein PG991_015452 [Apiospora marii]|uniref:Uncharacterized protein n=1 Tax=Apiospora marii TaxID=335849 RepID=A0ABR1R1T8_9PEZI